MKNRDKLIVILMRDGDGIYCRSSFFIYGRGPHTTHHARGRARRRSTLSTAGTAGWRQAGAVLRGPSSRLPVQPRVRTLARCAFRGFCAIAVSRYTLCTHELRFEF